MRAQATADALSQKLDSLLKVGQEIRRARHMRQENKDDRLPRHPVSAGTDGSRVPADEAHDPETEAQEQRAVRLVSLSPYSPMQRT